ncbi:MAG TPA: hypothetical protein VF331_05780, partial [Polyangiales bacterium]
LFQSFQPIDHHRRARPITHVHAKMVEEMVEEIAADDRQRRAEMHACPGLPVDSGPPPCAIGGI